MTRLAEDSRNLARAIRSLKRRHERTTWPKYQGQKDETCQILSEAATLLNDAAKILEGAI
jgi:hypothetical protein